MKIEPYALTAEQAATFAWLATSVPDERLEISALRITYDDPHFGWLSVFSVQPDEWRGPYWCNFAMFGVSTTEDDGTLLFDCCNKKLGELVRDDADADGYAKWDGCREVGCQAHCCGDNNFREYMNALAATVMQASRLAGYEGDGKL